MNARKLQAGQTYHGNVSSRIYHDAGVPVLPLQELHQGVQEQGRGAQGRVQGV